MAPSQSATRPIVVGEALKINVAGEPELSTTVQSMVNNARAEALRTLRRGYTASRSVRSTGSDSNAGVS